MPFSLTRVRRDLNGPSGQSAQRRAPRKRVQPFARPKAMMITLALAALFLPQIWAIRRNASSALRIAMVTLALIPAAISIAVSLSAAADGISIVETAPPDQDTAALLSYVATRGIPLLGAALPLYFFEPTGSRARRITRATASLLAVTAACLIAQQVLLARFEPRFFVQLDKWAEVRNWISTGATLLALSSWASLMGIASANAVLRPRAWAKEPPHD